MYTFLEVRILHTSWPAMTSVVVCKNGKRQALRHISMARSMKDWIFFIQALYQKGITFEDCDLGLRDCTVLREIAVVGEDVLKDLFDLYPEHHI